MFVYFLIILNFESYKEGFDKLRDVKAEIERIQLLLEKSRDRMQKDFEKWLAVMLDQRKVAAPKIEIGSELKNVIFGSNSGYF